MFHGILQIMESIIFNLQSFFLLTTNVKKYLLYVQVYKKYDGCSFHFKQKLSHDVL